MAKIIKFDSVNLTDTNYYPTEHSLVGTPMKTLNILVDGKIVKRKYPNHLKRNLEEPTKPLDDYIKDLMKGLRLEFRDKDPEILPTSFKKGDILFEETDEEE